MRSPLKWVGSKNRIMPQLAAHLPKGKRLVEPFAGSCSVMLNTDYNMYLLGDSNKDLIDFFHQVKYRPEDLIDAAQFFFSQATTLDHKPYLNIRELFNKRIADDLEQAAMFLYLNKFGFNGLCRYNKSGGFNVPFGSRKNIPVPGSEILAASDKLQSATLFKGDWLDTLRQVREGDVVYIDPPYIPMSATANFSDYTKEGFVMADQIKLRDALVDLAQYGIPIVVSNSHTKAALDLYTGFTIHNIHAARSVGGQPNVKEIIATINC